MIEIGLIVIQEKKLRIQINYQKFKKITTIDLFQEVELMHSLKFYKKKNILENNKKSKFKLPHLYQIQTVTHQVQKYLIILEKN